MIFRNVPALLAAIALGASAAASDTFERLIASGQVYERVSVLSVNATSISVRHTGGIAQIPLSALEPDLQARFGYDPESAAARERDLDQLRRQRAEQEAERLAQLRASAAAQQKARRSGASAAFADFAQPPKLRPVVDLRERFGERGIHVRNQGRFPSCAIHSILAAIEYQSAAQTGAGIDLSEFHVYQSTCRILGRSVPNPNAPSSGGVDELADAGFRLEDVIQGIRAFGLAVENIEGKPLDERGVDLQFYSYALSGDSAPDRVAKIVHMLNAGYPVAVGLRWPPNAVVRNTSLISKQIPSPNNGHAVTFVGYRCDGGRIENAVFIFRNSWGPSWGAGGYGFVTYDYVAANLLSCFVVELN